MPKERYELKVYPSNRNWSSISFRYNDMEALMIAMQSMLEHNIPIEDDKDLVCEISIVKEEREDN